MRQMSVAADKLSSLEKTAGRPARTTSGVLVKKINQELFSYNTRDLMRASGCDHCIKIAIARELDMPGVRDLLKDYEVTDIGLPGVYGDRFESDLEGELRAYLPVEDFQRPEGVDLAAATLELMQAGIPVIYQGALKHRIGMALFSGKPDFLVREDYVLSFVDGKLTANHSNQITGQTISQTSGHFRYIAWDAKLASSAKPNYLLQVALYVDALEQAGFKAEARHGLILGSREFVTFEEGEIVPAMRQARSHLLAILNDVSRATDLSAYELDNLSLACDNKDSCQVCEYKDLCELTRVAEDHLIQVANINRSQIEKLKRAGIRTMAALADATDEMRPSDFVPGSFDKLRKQARLQTAAKQTGKHDFLILNDPEIAVLPPASSHDLFFDMEGFPYFAEKGGLEYLFGAVNRQKQFHDFWAHDRNDEAEAFISFVKFAVAEMQADPAAHIYHYAPYEVTALNKLAARHGVMEEEVAWLIEDDRLIDLYKVVRNSIMISQPSYSIKALEVFYGLERSSDVKTAGSSIEFYEEFRQVRESEPELAAELLKTIRDYNEEDCVSTLDLYSWLSSMPAAHSKYAEFRQAVAAKKADERRRGDSRDDSPESRRARKAELELERLNRETQSLQLAIANWPWGEDESADYQAKIWLALTHSMLFYNREEVIQWRDWRIRRDATDDAIDRDRKALRVDGCQLVGEEPSLFGLAAETKQKLAYRYTLEPGQTNFLKTGQAIFVRFNLGANQQDTDYGRVVSIEGDEVIFQRDATVATAPYEPNAIYANEWMPLADKPRAVADWVTDATERWGSPSNPAPTGSAVFDLLMRRQPALMGGAELPTAEQSDYLPAIISAVDQLTHSTLAIQGPPGSGKTYLASRTIKHLVERKKRVAVAANSHSAIENLLSACIDAGVESSKTAKRSQKDDRAQKPWFTPNTNGDMASWRAQQEAGYVIGGTSWNFASAAYQQEPFDYLFIDESAQFSLVDAIATGANAKNIVLLGDPQQLTQVVQALHPGGVDNSALGHYMGEQEILHSKFGYFVEVTRRMHPAVNEPVSWLAYHSRLHSHEDASKNEITGLVPGFTALPIAHLGNGSHSVEEAEFVVQLVKQRVDQLQKTGIQGSAKACDFAAAQEEVLVVAPYNAQVDLIRDMLDAAGFKQVQVGTVDKFQGREAMVVIVSLAASSAADAPRGLDFLLDRNRLNVALSRAKSNSYLVYSPELVRTRFSSVVDLTSVSRLTGLLDFALT